MVTSRYNLIVPIENRSTNIFYLNVHFSTTIQHVFLILMAFLVQYRYERCLQKKLESLTSVLGCTNTHSNSKPLNQNMGSYLTRALNDTILCGPWFIWTQQDCNFFCLIFIVGVLYDPCCCGCLKYGVLSCGVLFAVRNKLQKI
jgi:hypothetical protein